MCLIWDKLGTKIQQGQTWDIVLGAVTFTFTTNLTYTILSEIASSVKWEMIPNEEHLIIWSVFSLFRDNYGFVTFAYTCDAYAAIESKYSCWFVCSQLSLPNTVAQALYVYMYDADA